MATSTDFAGTVCRSSAEAFTFECDACKLDGKIQEARFFCPECDDYLCPSCEIHHKKVKATRFHEIDSVNETFCKLSRQKIHDVKQNIKNECACGQKEEIEFYCKEHDACFCLHCKNVKHRRCSTSAIHEICEEPSVLTDFSALVKTFDVLFEKSIVLKTDCDKQKKKLGHIEEKCKDDIRKFRSKLKMLLDECQRINLEDLQQVVEKLSGQLEDNNTAVTSMQQLLTKDNQLAREINKTEDKRQLFIASIKLRKSMNEYGAVLDDVKKKLDIPNIFFEHQKGFDDLQCTFKSLGKIYMTYNSKVAEDMPVLIDATVKQNTGVNIKHLSKEEPSIAGLAFLKDGKLLIADHTNDEIALLDADLRILETIDVEGSPYDIALMSDTVAVVTLPYQQDILYIQIDPKIQIKHKQNLHNRCWGVTYSNGNIYVACNFSGENPEILELVGESGALKSRIKYNEMSKEVTSSYIFNIATNRDGTKIYISDYMSHKVLCMNRNGQRIFVYSDPDMKYPRGILVDAEENVLVCCEASSNVHVINSDGKKHKILLKAEDGVQTPFAIDYRIRDGMLVIGCWQKTNIMAFYLKL